MTEYDKIMQDMSPNKFATFMADRSTDNDRCPKSPSIADLEWCRKHSTCRECWLDYWLDYLNQEV